MSLLDYDFKKGYRVKYLPRRSITEFKINCIGYHCLKNVKAQRTFWTQNHITVHYVIKGKGYLRINNSEHSITAGQVFIIPANVPFYYFPDTENPWDYVFFQINGSQAENYFNDLNFDFLTNVFTCNDNSAIETKIMDVFDDQNDLFVNSKTHCVCYTLLYEILKDIVTITNYNPYLLSAELYTNLLTYIKLNYHNPDFSVNDILLAFPYSHSFLCKYFKKKNGNTLVGYIKQLRLNKAKELLTTTDLSINEIVIRSGFKEYYYFLNVFKKLTGMTVLEFRNSVKIK